MFLRGLTHHFALFVKGFTVASNLLIVRANVHTRFHTKLCQLLRTSILGYIFTQNPVAVPTGTIAEDSKVHCFAKRTKAFIHALTKPLLQRQEQLYL